MVFGDATVLGRGVTAPATNGLVARLRLFFARICHENPAFEVFARDNGRFVDDVAGMREKLGRKPGAVVFVHYPYADLASGVPVDTLLDAYRQLAETCRSSGATCIIGGQQPVDALPPGIDASQLDLERRASAALGSTFLPLYRYFQSQAAGRRLMVPFDSGDGRLVNDEGHEVLFELFRRRLLERVDR